MAAILFRPQYVKIDNTQKRDWNQWNKDAVLEAKYIFKAIASNFVNSAA